MMYDVSLQSNFSLLGKTKRILLKFENLFEELEKRHAINCIVIVQFFEEKKKRQLDKLNSLLY